MQKKNPVKDRRNKKRRRAVVVVDKQYPQATIVDVRQAIIDRLKQLKRSRYWLAQQVAGHVTTSAVYSYLADRYDMAGSTIEQMLMVLGLEIRPRK